MQLFLFHTQPLIIWLRGNNSNNKNHPIIIPGDFLIVIAFLLMKEDDYRAQAAQPACMQGMTFIPHSLGWKTQHSIHILCSHCDRRSDSE